MKLNESCHYGLFWGAFRLTDQGGHDVTVRWDLHTGNAAPYTVDATFMERVEQVVGWSLDRGASHPHAVLVVAYPPLHGATRSNLTQLRATYLSIQSDAATRNVLEYAREYCVFRAAVLTPAWCICY